MERREQRKCVVAVHDDMSAEIMSLVITFSAERRIDRKDLLIYCTDVVLIDCH